MEGFIYKIINLINNKVYIGQTVNSLEQRFIEHKSHWKNNYNSSNRPLYNAFSKYGIENFQIELVEKVEQSNLNNREKYWIKYYDSYNNGYNATWGGDSTILYDYNKIVELYNIKQNMSEVARIIGCQWATVSRALKSAGLEKTKKLKMSNSKVIIMLDKNNNFIQRFDRLMDAAIYIKQNQYTQNSNLSSISGTIGQVCRGERKSAYGFKWTYAK